MRKYLALSALALLLAVPTHAQQQQQEETVTVPRSMLSKQQLEEVAAKNMEERVKQYGSWIGIGHEIGIAVNEGLSAVTNQSNAFAQTSVGKWTMFVIIFKVIGGPMLGLLFATCMFLFGLPLWVWSIRKWMPHRMLMKEIVDPESGKVIQRQYDVVKPREADGHITVHYIAILLMIGIAAIAVFAPL